MQRSIGLLCHQGDAEFVQKLKEKLKVVYRDGEVKIGLNGKLKVPAACNSEKNRLKIYITSPDLVKIAQEAWLIPCQDDQ